MDLDELLARRPPVEFEVELDEADAAVFHSRGFVTIARITTDNELAWLREVYDHLFAARLEPVKGGRFDLVRPYGSDGDDLLPQVIMPEARCPQLKETAFWRNGKALASRLLGLGAGAVQGWGHMIRKPARVGEALPWHQDEAYWDPGFDYRALGCWMPLDLATIESGCMRFIPGSHRGEVLPHRHLGDDPKVHALFTQLEAADIARAVPAPTAAGGAVLHNCRMVHSSGPNVSDHVRRAWAVEWQAAPAPREVPTPRPWWRPRRTSPPPEQGGSVGPR